MVVLGDLRACPEVMVNVGWRTHEDSILGRRTQLSVMCIAAVLHLLSACSGTGTCVSLDEESEEFKPETTREGKSGAPGGVALREPDPAARKD